MIIISEMIRRKFKLLNRLDASSPSKDEVKQVARELAGKKDVEYPSKRESTWSYRLGKWVGRHKGLVRIVAVLETRLGMFSVTQWLGILVVVVILCTIYYQKTHYTNRIYLKELIESNTIEKAASGIVASARKAESAKGIGNDEWKVIEQRLSDCMVKEAKLYLVSDHPYLLERANKDTPRILSARFMRSCGAID